MLVPFAQAMYLSFFTYPEIAKRLHVPPQVVKDWAQKRRWRELREDVNEDLLADVYERMRRDMEEVASDAIEVIAAGMRNLKRDPENVDPRIMFAVSQIFANLKPALRVSNGLPQNIPGDHDGVSVPLPRTAADIKKVLASDPFTRDLKPPTQDPRPPADGGGGHGDV